MSENNPFNDYIDDDRTIIRPNPGGRKSATPPPGATEGRESLPQQLAYSSGNPLTDNAMALLSLYSQLRKTVSHTDIAGLRISVINEVRRFENNLRNQSVAAEQIQAARYALCTLLDEAVLNTPWGGNSLWGTQSLLITFHKEAWGGEKFFSILKNAMQQPAIHLNLLEFLYFCLCLGFEGKYRIEDHGATKLEEVRENLYLLIQRQRGDSDRALSLQWEGRKDTRHVLTKLVPLWVIGSFSFCLALVVYLGFLYAITVSSEQPFNRLYQIKNALQGPIPPHPAPAPIPAINSHLIELKGFLSEEVRLGEVSVEQKDGKTVVRILKKGLFASGSDSLTDESAPLLAKISSALTKVTGQILVVGHTDNVPIGFSVRFPSNWALSKARAQTVMDLLKSNPQWHATVTADGRADKEPLVTNDTPAHRAMNRRVDIIF